MTAPRPTFFAEEGDKCNNPGCAGVYGYDKVENCDCPNGFPPCSSCVNNPLVCLLCGYEPNEEQK